MVSFLLAVRPRTDKYEAERHQFYPKPLKKICGDVTILYSVTVRIVMATV